MNLIELITQLGLLAVFATVFIESGLLIGFFLPGDSLLFTAGLLASRGVFPISLLIIGCIVCAITGDSLGYYLGRKLGSRVFKENSRFLNHGHRQKAEEFYRAHGPKTIVLARFLPVVRAFAPTLAGVGQMPYKQFIFYNVTGGIGWVVLMTLLGYFLGRAIPNVDHYIIPIALGIIIISFLPALFSYVKRRLIKI